MTLKEARKIWVAANKGYTPPGFEIEHHGDCGYWSSACCQCHPKCKLIRKKK